MTRLKPGMSASEACSLDHEDKTGGPDYVWAVRDYEPPASVAAEKFVPATVPTVTPWGVGCFALLLGAAGVFFLRRGWKGRLADR